MKPLLFLDVDGVLNPDSVSSGRRPEGFETHRMRPSGWTNPRQKPLRVWLNPTHGEMLKALPVELVWGTAWEHEANEWIGPHLGLPKLPVVEFGTCSRPSARIHWKTDYLWRYANGRPFVWLDDEIHLTYDNAWIRARVTQPYLLIQVPPLKGLLQEHLDRVREFAQALDDGRLD